MVDKERERDKEKQKNRKREKKREREREKENKRKRLVIKGERRGKRRLGVVMPEGGMGYRDDRKEG